MVVIVLFTPGRELRLGPYETVHFRGSADSPALQQIWSGLLDRVTPLEKRVDRLQDGRFKDCMGGTWDTCIIESSTNA